MSWATHQLPPLYRAMRRSPKIVNPNLIVIARNRLSQPGSDYDLVSAITIQVSDRGNPTSFNHQTFWETWQHSAGTIVNPKFSPIPGLWTHNNDNVWQLVAVNIADYRGRSDPMTVRPCPCHRPSRINTTVAPNDGHSILKLNDNLGSTVTV